MFKKKNSALDTRKKGGKATPAVSFDYVVNDLLEYFKGFKGLQDAESEIEKKYNIDNNNKDKDDVKNVWNKDDVKNVWNKDDVKKVWNKDDVKKVWNKDDVKKAWGKTQRMYKYSRRRKTWSLAILLRAISDITLNKTNCSCETTADINVGPNAGTERSLQIYEITQNNTKKRSYDDSTMDEPTKRSCVAIKGESNAATESQNFTCENTPNTNEEPNAGTLKFENKEMCEEKKKSGSYADSQTVYIRIPLSFLDVSQEIICQKAEKKAYKLIDGVPSLTQTMKKTSFVMQYDNRTKNVAWVFEILNKQTCLEPKDLKLKKDKKKTSNFSQDRGIPEHYKTPHNVSYGESYDRGHMAAASNHNWSQKAMQDTFFISNAAPQIKNLNRSAWKKLENTCRKYTKDYNNVYVYTGPLYCPPDPNIDTITYQIIEGKAVPTHFFKVMILEKHDGTLDVECYKAANANGQICDKAELDDIQRWSGLVFSEKSELLRKEERVTVQWSAQEKTSEKHSVATTFTITPSQDSTEHVF